MAEPLYTGEEKAVEITIGELVSEDLWEVRADGIPAGAVPVFEESTNAVIGYRHQLTTGVFRLYDLDGNVVGMEEVGLESSALSPLDLIFFTGGILRAIGRGIVTGFARTAPKVAATGASRLTAPMLAAAVVGAMRTALRKMLSARSLKFTATTAARMESKARQVPLFILHLGIKHGKRAPDPQGVKGAFLYTTRMLKNGREYALEIVVREKDWTILHFLYK